MSDIWDTAKEMEIEGRDLYEKLGQEAKNKELGRVFNRLAREEQRHYNLFNNLQQNVFPEMTESDNVVADVKKVFAGLTEQFKEEEILEDTETVYRKALAMEEKSVAFYSDIRNQVEGQAQQNAVNTIINEEKRHAEIIRAFMEFVRRPKEWLENAEFNHLEEY